MDLTQPRSPRSGSKGHSHSPSFSRSHKRTASKTPTAAKDDDEGGSKSMFSFTRHKSATKLSAATPASTTSPSTPASVVATSGLAAPSPSSRPSSPSRHGPSLPSFAGGASFMKKVHALDKDKGGSKAQSPAQRRGGGAHKKGSYLRERLPLKLSQILAALLVLAVGVFFYGHRPGPRLVKRDAPLYRGDVLRSNEYITFCTGILAFGCEGSKHFILNDKGELALFAGSGPDSAGKKLWSSGTKSKGGKDIVRLETDNLVISREGRVTWKSPVSRLPKTMRPWPLSV